MAQQKIRFTLEGFLFKTIKYQSFDYDRGIGIIVEFVNEAGDHVRHAAPIESPVTPEKVARALRDLAHFCETNKFLERGKV